MMVSDPPAEPVELVAVINSFNRLPLLREAIGALTEALRAAPQLRGAVIVYEVGSTDGSRDFLEEWTREHREVRVDVVRPEPGASTTFSDGVNVGCAEALRRFPHSKFLLLYETDNWIAGPEPLLQAQELLHAQPELAAVGWTVRMHTGAMTRYGMRFPSAFQMAVGLNVCFRFGWYGPNAMPWQTGPGGIEWRRCDVVYTSPLLIRRTAWEKSGGFDAQVFPFSDCDVDWAWRCRRLGLGEQAVLRSDAVVHDNRTQASAWSSDRVVKFHRARMALLKRHHGSVRANLIKPLLFFRHGVETAMLWPKRKHFTVAPKLASRLHMLRTVWRDYRTGTS